MSNSLNSPSVCGHRQRAGNVYMWHCHIILIGALEKSTLISLTALYSMTPEELTAHSRLLDTVFKEFGGEDLL